MSEIKIASILISKRREKGITQEELAGHMGVSKAAVSKWEKEQSYPDVTLLPHLATYFNISVDELLGYSPQLTREGIRKLCHKLSEKFSEIPFDEAIAECKAAVKEYYACFPLLYNMAALLANLHLLAETKEKQEEVLGDAIALCERVVSECGDALLAKDALYLQCFCCILLEKPDDVFLRMGETFRMPEFTEDRLISLAFQLAENNAKAKEISQCGIYMHLLSLIESMLDYIMISEEIFDTAEIAYNRIMELTRLFNVKELYPFLLVKAYLLGANLYCLHGDSKKALELLEQFADMSTAFIFPIKVQGDSFFTDIDQWLEDSELGSSVPLDERIVKKNMLHSLTAIPSFSVLGDEPQYRNIVRRISDFINK